MIKDIEKRSKMKINKQKCMLNIMCYCITHLEDKHLIFLNPELKVVALRY